MNPLSPKPLSRPVRHITLSRGLWLWILPGEVVQWMTWETLNSDPNRSISPVRITALYLCEDNSGVGLQLFMIEPCYYHWECFPPHSFLPWTWRFGGIWELKNNNWKSGIMTWRIDFRIHLLKLHRTRNMKKCQKGKVTKAESNAHQLHLWLCSMISA